MSGVGIRVQLSAASANLVTSELLPGTVLPNPLERNKSVRKVGAELERNRITIHQILQAGVRAVELSKADADVSVLQHYLSLQAGGRSGAWKDRRFNTSSRQRLPSSRRRAWEEEEAGV